MAEVISLTETKIQELLAGWEGVSLTQDDITALITELRQLVLSTGSGMAEFNEVIRPQLQSSIMANNIDLQNLLANQIPSLEARASDVQTSIDELQETTIPEMQQELATQAAVVAESPTVYIQAAAPEDPDENDRYLVVGDVWYDSDDNNTQRIWNGSAWTSFNIDVGELTVQVKNFVSGKHQIY